MFLNIPLQIYFSENFFEECPGVEQLSRIDSVGAFFADPTGSLR